jgi:hypothetical protein
MHWPLVRFQLTRLRLQLRDLDPARLPLVGQLRLSRVALHSRLRLTHLAVDQLGAQRLDLRLQCRLLRPTQRDARLALSLQVNL